MQHVDSSQVLRLFFTSTALHLSHNSSTWLAARRRRTGETYDCGSCVSYIPLALTRGSLNLFSLRDLPPRLHCWCFLIPNLLFGKCIMGGGRTCDRPGSPPILLGHSWRGRSWWSTSIPAHTVPSWTGQRRNVSYSTCHQACIRVALSARWRHILWVRAFQSLRSSLGSSSRMIHACIHPSPSGIHSDQKSQRYHFPNLPGQDQYCPRRPPAGRPPKRTRCRK